MRLVEDYKISKEVKMVKKLETIQYNNRVYTIDWKLQELRCLEHWEFIPMSSEYGQEIMKVYQEINK